MNELIDQSTQKIVMTETPLISATEQGQSRSQYPNPLKISF